jgi:hypothetical protein
LLDAYRVGLHRSEGARLLEELFLHRLTLHPSARANTPPSARHRQTPRRALAVDNREPSASPPGSPSLPQSAGDSRLCRSWR